MADDGYDMADAGNAGASGSRLVLIFKLSGLTLGAVLAVLLVIQLVSSRPLDLRAQTEETARVLEEIFMANRLSREDVFAQDAVLQQTDTAHWYLYEYDVRVPASIDQQGLEALIEKTMRNRMVLVSSLFEGGQRAGISLAFGEFTFANIRLAQAPPTTMGMAPPKPTPPPAETTVVENEDSRPDVEPRLGGVVVEHEGSESDPKPEAAPATQVSAAAAVVEREGSESDPKPEATPATQVSAATAVVEREGTESDPKPEATAASQAADVERVDSVFGRAPEVNAKTQVAAATPHSSTQPRLAIIVDDGGYGGRITDAILALSPALTLSILPHTRYATETAKRAAARGFEVMLHMPMENASNQSAFDKQIESHMSETEIANLTKLALIQVPGAAGVNNHMGSKFTSDPRAMALFFSGIRDLDLFFIDSRTTPASRAYEIARAFGIPTAQRDLFLDDENDAVPIDERFAQIVALAKENGSAIAICHFRSDTAAALEKLLPILDVEGVRLVHASQLVQ